MRQFAETTHSQEKMPQPSEYSNLEENNAFYRDFWESQPAYRNRCPNVEEADARADPTNGFAIDRVLCASAVKKNLRACGTRA